MRKIEKCCICEKDIQETDKIIKVKEKILYEDNGIWYNFKNSCICFSCLSEIRDKVKAKV